MLRTTLTRIPLSLSLRASSSRSVRALSSTARAQRDILEEFSEQITPRELVERKRKEMEAKYGDKLKKKAEA
jgi:ATP synthase F1 complex assembly factor 1